MIRKMIIFTAAISMTYILIPTLSFSQEDEVIAEEVIVRLKKDKPKGCTTCGQVTITLPRITSSSGVPQIEFKADGEMSPEDERKFNECKALLQKIMEFTAINTNALRMPTQVPGQPNPKEQSILDEKRGEKNEATANWVKAGCSDFLTHEVVLGAETAGEHLGAAW